MRSRLRSLLNVEYKKICRYRTVIDTTILGLNEYDYYGVSCILSYDVLKLMNDVYEANNQYCNMICDTVESDMGDYIG